jgi:Na+-driven multidrug efflux pump
MPAAIQSVITAFSNIFVQGYINIFGSDCMAGWSSYNKLDQFVMLPMQSLAIAATTFVSQNIGAKKESRADEGTVKVVFLSVSVTFVIALLLFVFAHPAIRMFSSDESVIEFGSLFIHTNVFFLLFNCVNHTLAGALRGRGDSTGPMVIMLTSFVAIRQIYLFVVTHFVANTPILVGFGYPVGWMSCCILEVCYFLIRYKFRKSDSNIAYRL